MTSDSGHGGSELPSLASTSGHYVHQAPMSSSGFSSPRLPPPSSSLSNGGYTPNKRATRKSPYKNRRNQQSGDHEDLSSSQLDSYPSSSGASKSAFISEDDDLGPVDARSFLLQTEDQAKLHSLLTSSPNSLQPFLSLEPPISVEDYNFTLNDNEGIAELFGQDEEYFSSNH